MIRGSSCRKTVQKKTKTHKYKFTPEEDKELDRLVNQFGIDDWCKIASFMKNRTVRQCKDRWSNYINPNISLQEWSENEDKLLLERHSEIGPHWRTLAEYFPNRSVNAVRNRVVKLLKQTSISHTGIRNKPKLTTKIRTVKSSTTKLKKKINKINEENGEPELYGSNLFVLIMPSGNSAIDIFMPTIDPNADDYTIPNFYFVRVNSGFATISFFEFNINEYKFTLQ